LLWWKTTLPAGKIPLESAAYLGYKNTTPTALGAAMRLDRLKPKTLQRLYQIAKHPEKGVRPFFIHPKAMIELRRLVHVDMKEPTK
jgi:hypothetical protein